MTESDLRYLRYAIMIAERARQHGSPPFGAILVSSWGSILSEGENTRPGFNATGVAVRTGVRYRRRSAADMAGNPKLLRFAG